MPSRKCAALRTALPNRSKNWPLCFYNEDADGGKKSNDLISLWPKQNKNSCRWVTAEQVFQGSRKWGVTLRNPHCFYNCMNSPSWYALQSGGTTPESQKDWRGWCSKPNLFPYWCTNEKSVWALICSGKAAAEVDGWWPGPVSSPHHPSLGVNPTPAGQTTLLFGSLKRRKLFPKLHFTGTVNCSCLKNVHVHCK